MYRRVVRRAPCLSIGAEFVHSPRSSRARNQLAGLRRGIGHAATFGALANRSRAASRFSSPYHLRAHTLFGLASRKKRTHANVCATKPMTANAHLPFSAHATDGPSHNTTAAAM